MHWKLKAAAFKAMEKVPFGEELHFLMQRRVTKTWPRPASILTLFLEGAREIVDIFEAHSEVPLGEADFLEIGAGRDLAMPIALILVGVKHVIAVDIARLAKLDLVNHATQLLAGELGRQVAPFESWEDVKTFGIDYRAPHDLEADPAVGPVDAFISNEVLEHIPPRALQNVLKASRDFLTKGGLSIHSIDYSDHYARGGDVSRYNFLKFDDRQWERRNSSFQYVNRLRHSQYLAMHDAAGLAVMDATTYSEALPADVAEGLAAQFRGFAMDDLEIMRSRIVARRL